MQRVSIVRDLLRFLGNGERATPPARPIRSTPLPFAAADFLGRPALACRFAERRAVIGYVDRDGQPSLRAVTFDELFYQNGHRYLGGYCHARFERRHFRLDRIASMQRFATGELVDPAGEVAEWTGRGESGGA